MRKIILYSASSLDNYIARKNHSVDFLFTESDFGFNDFYKSVDTLLMGRKTYDVSLKLSPIDEPFKGKEVFIFSKNKNFRSSFNEKVICDNPVEFTNNLITEKGSDIWLVGGGEITKLFLGNNLIDEIVLSIHPVILGEGIPLFISHKEETKLKLVESKSYNNGLIQVKYKVSK